MCFDVILDCSSELLMNDCYSCLAHGAPVLEVQVSLFNHSLLKNIKRKSFVVVVEVNW